MSVAVQQQQQKKKHLVKFQTWKLCATEKRIKKLYDIRKMKILLFFNHWHLI